MATDAGVEYKLKFHDTNYNTDDFSRLYLHLAADDSVRRVSAKAPSAEVMNRTSDDRKPGDGNRLRRVEAQFRLAEEEPRAVSKPAFPPDGVHLQGANRRVAYRMEKASSET